LIGFFATFKSMSSIESILSLEISSVHIELSNPLGGGDGYYVMINNYYNGRVWKTNYGWQHDLNPKTILQGDVAVIIGLIEENL